MIGSEGARRVAGELAREGIVVVSGLAAGVDTAALTAALAAGGRVVGVIGTPLDRAYPARNRHLQERISLEHLLVSRFAAGERIRACNFPMRNRLMAALSDATVIIEAGERSGTLHQAAECLRLERWLFIARSLIEDPILKWPAKFLGRPRVAPLESTSAIVSALRRTP
jgi:DNA processing protein